MWIKGVSFKHSYVCPGRETGARLPSTLVSLALFVLLGHVDGGMGGKSGGTFGPMGGNARCRGGAR